MITGYRCASCGATVGIDAVMPWRCPGAVGDDRRHVLQIQDDGNVPARDDQARDDPARDDPARDDPNPFIAFGPRLAWRAFAVARGMSPERCDELTREVDAAIARVAGTGFTWTPFGRQDRLSDALGFSASGGVWVKDETHSVAGSHKARHLMSILLHLLAAEELGLCDWTHRSSRPPLAIASCGNAAIAASTLAAAAEWPIVVFVPPWSSPSVSAHLTRLGATLTVCPRESADPPGDPCLHRFRETVARGAIPFSVQGPENALCLDGGRTIGWEIAEQITRAGQHLDRIVVQVGGGAFATAMAGAALSTSASLIAAQTEGCAPLARAWGAARGLTGGVAAAPSHWDQCMWPWESEPTSFADGILDDETYDWVGVVQAMDATGGEPVVVPESAVVEAARMGPELTGIDASPTGTAGLAGLLAMRDRIGDDECVAIVFSGVRRD